ncbi:hypothetical protein K439DRAFT_1300817, partial [Ramaria rubella]
PRCSIEFSRHSSIDISLKDFRNVAQRTLTFSTSFSNELQLLNRIFYKGKNQHRSAIFWRKIQEVRRLGTRIKELNIPRLVEDWRYAFYTEDRANPKKLRGAWEQTPDETACTSMLRRIHSVCLLINQTRIRLRFAYSAFTRQVRTATFIPLAISLVSITSRLDFLVSGLYETLALYWRALARVLE